MTRNDLVDGAKYLLVTNDTNGFALPRREWIQVTYNEHSGFMDDDGCHWNEWLHEKDGILEDANLIMLV